MAAANQFSTVEEVDRLIEASHAQPVVLFKHSTSCPISHLAKARVDKAIGNDQENLQVHFLDLLAHRDVSNYIAEVLGVRHESPQAIVISKGKAVHTATHLSIDPSKFSTGN